MFGYFSSKELIQILPKYTSCMPCKAETHGLHWVLVTSSPKLKMEKKEHYKNVCDAFGFVTEFTGEGGGGRSISQSPNNWVFFYTRLAQTGILFSLCMYSWVSFLNGIGHYLALRNWCYWTMGMKFTEELHILSSRCTDRNLRAKSSFCWFTRRNSNDDKVASWSQ